MYNWKTLTFSLSFLNDIVISLERKCFDGTVRDNVSRKSRCRIIMLVGALQTFGLWALGGFLTVFFVQIRIFVIF